ncbi:SixA phosphatase family protein [Thalassospira mesophila]|uniref:SixA phosphatase family protein n=1 Tax=Thalassospira mesophila TaxID=1293891 RepID=UPI000A1D8BDC|nr:histidine phosphatase family protein [Thalassospira mesophila]
MKTLLLLRHAKSSWADPGRADHDRDLNARGEKAAPVMGRFLYKQNLIPDLVWCSTAQRTVQTVGLLGRSFANEAKVIYARDMYMATETALLKCLHQTHDEAATVLMVGHNPGLESFAMQLAGVDENGLRDDMAAKYPTCALCQFEFDVDAWGDVGWGQGRLARFVKVRDLQADIASVTDNISSDGDSGSADT